MSRPLRFSVPSLLLGVLLGCSGEEAPIADDADGDGYASADDCDDADASVHPDATESCNDRDDDCDDAIDEDLAFSFWPDADGDGYGDAGLQQSGCVQAAGTVVNDDDCDDAAIAVNPGAAERCDGLDNNCSGFADEGVLLTLYLDADGDGYGDVTGTGEGCDATDGLSATNDDCDDTNAAAHPGAEEADCADPTDYDCDGHVTYTDVDLDGWAACLDCDDDDLAISPDAAELCDAVDNDCDDAIDEEGAEDAYAWYADIDGDGYGDPSGARVYACSQPVGYVADSADCDDLNSHVNPSIPEICDGFDDDCDGLEDEGC